MRKQMKLEKWEIKPTSERIEFTDEGQKILDDGQATIEQVKLVKNGSSLPSLNVDVRIGETVVRFKVYNPVVTKMFKKNHELMIGAKIAVPSIIMTKGGTLSTAIADTLRVDGVVDGKVRRFSIFSKDESANIEDAETDTGFKFNDWVSKYDEYQSLGDKGATISSAPHGMFKRIKN